MAAKMRTVVVKAANLKPGDVLNGERITNVLPFPKRTPKCGWVDKDALMGVMVVTPNANGYDLRAQKLRGDKRVKVKRPKYNMTSRS